MAEMKNPICLECGLYKDCVNPKTKGTGNTRSPKYLFVLPYPEVEDDDGNPFTGYRARVLTQALEGKDPDDFAITYLVKCPAYKNTISREGFREPTPHETESCMKHLYKELHAFQGATIMAFGAFAVKTLCGDPELKITKEIGLKRKVTIGDLEFDLVPNLDPGMALKHANLMADFKLQVDKLFGVAAGHAEVHESAQDRWKILNFDEAMTEMDRAINLFKEGKIKKIIFDLENSISLDPWGGGEVIMSSFAHKMDSRGFAVPFVVDNTIRHTKKIQDPDWFPNPRYPNAMPEMLTVPMVPEDFPYDIPYVDFDITPQQRQKLLNKTQQMIELIPISGHNLGYDMRWTAWKRIASLEKIRIARDTFNASFQMNNSGPGIDNSLKGNARKLFNVADDWEKKVEDWLPRFKRIDDRHYGNIPTGMLGEYSALDSYYNQMLDNYYDENLPESMLPITEMIDEAIIPFAEAGIKGMAIDVKMQDFLRSSYKQYLIMKRGQIDELPMVKKLIAKYIGPFVEKNPRKKKPLTATELREAAFNMNYPKKVEELVYSEDFYNLPKLKRFLTEAGSYQVNKESRAYFLEEYLNANFMRTAERKKPEEFALLSEAKTFLTKLGELKRISKLLNDYIETMPKSTYEGLYKPSFKLNGTTTGRLSSPFHSMPNGCDIKRLITSRWRQEGGLIVAADQSQLELRVVAALSNEKKLIEAFEKGYDIHTFTGSEIYGVPIEEVTEDQRRVGKTSNFAMLYGKTEYNLAADLGIPVAEAKRILSNFFSSMDSLTEWMKERQAETRESGFVFTKYGRRIPVHTAGSTLEKDIAETNRLAVNYPVQSTAGDLVTDYNLKIIKRGKEEKLKSLFIASIHDSSEFDIYPGELFRLMNIFREEGQENLPKRHDWLICPLRLDFEIGVSWGGALKGEIEHLDASSLTFKAKGLRKDFMQLQATARRSYDVSIDVTDERPLGNKDFKDDLFVRDNRYWKGLIRMSARA